jgi:hypothetical protein
MDLTSQDRIRAARHRAELALGPRSAPDDARTGVVIAP